MISRETHAQQPLPCASQTDAPRDVLSIDDREKLKGQVDRLRSMVGRRSNKYWENAESALEVGLDILAEAFPLLGVGLLKTAFTSAIAASRGVRANREDALDLGDLVLSIAAEVMETLSINLPTDVTLDGACVDKLKAAIDEAVRVMDTVCGQRFFEAAWSHTQNRSDLRKCYDAIKHAFLSFLSAVGRAALEYCDRIDQRQMRTDKEVRELRAHIEKQQSDLQNQFEARERDAWKKDLRNFNQAIEFSKQVERNRYAIKSGDRSAIERLRKAAGSTDNELSNGMAQIGELSHVLPVVRQVEDAHTAALQTNTPAVAEQQSREQQSREQEAREQEAREQQQREQQAREQQQREQQERELQAVRDELGRERRAREQQTREQQERERQEREQRARELQAVRDEVAAMAERVREQELKNWIGQKGLSESILTDVIVDLHGKRLGDADMSTLAVILQSNASLEKLYLNSNKIGDSGAAALATAFPSMASLKVLWFNGNQIGDAGAAALAPAFKSMGSLTGLDLSFNQIGDAGAIGLSEGLKVNASLNWLSLGNNQIGDSGAAALATALPSMASLEQLWLNNNKIGDSGAAALATALPSMASLKELYLSGNKMGSHGKNTIRSAFKNANLYGVRF
jgi:hypothetical protein